MSLLHLSLSVFVLNDVSHFECVLIRYELRAVQLARLRHMKNENENAPNTSAYEVEMSETKQSTSNLDSVTDDIESGKE